MHIKALRQTGRWAATQRRCGLLVCTLAGPMFLLAAANAAVADSDHVAEENRVKALFIYNVAKFVQWPSADFAHSSDPLIIGMYDKGPVGDALDTIVRDRRINGHPVVIKQITSLDDTKAVHVAFFNARDDKRFAAMRGPLQDLPVLTVGESSSFAAQGGIIGFEMVGNKVRFEIDAAAARAARLKLSAQLQKLASKIRTVP